ncbi:MAG: sodium/proline symporter [Myxococcota bacterium]
MTLIGFTIAMLIFFGIGMASVMKSTKAVDDYLIAGRSISPISAGLSAVASNNSGFMFIGAIGYTYAYGFAAVWLFFGWIAGDYLSWTFVHRKLRRLSEERDTHSVAGFLANNGEGPDKTLQVLLGGLTVVFLCLYAAAQLKAGGKALQATLDWEPTTGIFIGTIMVIAYSFAGGIRASIWTDIAQSTVMIFAMLLLVMVCHLNVVPLAELSDALRQIDPGLMSFSPSNASLGVAPFALGWFIAGFGGIGQPHMIIRAMTVQSEDSIPTMRRTYFTWYILFSIFTMVVGLYSRVYFDGQSELIFDKEVALPMLASAHLAPLLVGFILAALFAATMSTADSQVLASSASITQDISTRHKDSYLASKVATVTVVALSMLIALVGPDSVFDLVTIAWGLMATCFAPLMVARVLGWTVSSKRYLIAAGLGMVSMLGWTHVLNLGDAMYDGAIGFMISMALTAALSGRK